MSTSVAVTETGFAVVEDRRTVADVQWADVQAIYAYTSNAGAGILCLDFVVPTAVGEEEERHVIVDATAEGWKALQSGVEWTFPSLDRDWLMKASVGEAPLDIADVAPKFVINVTEVWSREP